MNKASYQSKTLIITDLDKVDLILLENAIQATKRAYAPYSKFYVGAAARLDSGQIVVGANQENASYPLCMCGERIALYNASVNFPNESIVSLAIVAHYEKIPVDKAVSPCGACRQVIAEYEMRQDSRIRILLKGDTNRVTVFDGIDELLPFSFDASYLLKDI